MVKIGIADAHGVESYLDEKKALSWVLEMRALSNRQRHATLYRVELDESLNAQIEAELKKHDFIRALKLLKTAEHIRVRKGMENSWDLIPNPKLDPWYQEEAK